MSGISCEFLQEKLQKELNPIHVQSEEEAEEDDEENEGKDNEVKGEDDYKRSEREEADRKVNARERGDGQEVVDLTDGCGGKFSVVIVSDKFEGKPLLAQHRMVNDCLAEELKTIHALTLKTMKPAQWEKQKET
ncbi:BolA-like protein 2 [Stylophora pistillata]|uniref:BolA-like protein 2 n=1 Tax=Stylophora pistillata TaxID=50429 RepID=A0A2B4SIG3_STYPI|nr:BolA-like protein 2 [Stylophora pistillata]